jgi:toxin ParE1/3/4
MFELSFKAVEDIEGVIDYTIKNFGYSKMLAYHQSLDGCLQALSKNPDIGLNYNHVGLGYFCFYHQAHAIFYKRKNDDIFIIRMLHKSMDVMKHFD